MTSEKQIAANQRNAQKSTGPKTESGKAISAQNAVKHGILSENASSSRENGARYAELLEDLRSEFCPSGRLEDLLVERLANLFWRERRLVWTEQVYLAVSKHEWTNLIDLSTLQPTLTFSQQMLLGRYQTMLSNQISATLKELREIQATRAGAD